ncbi:hypothetical protein ACWEQG_01770 [Microbispora sp. NPDC004025]
MSGWTIDDAAQLLHPEMSTEEIRAMIELFSIPPYGSRRTGRRGRPLATYDPTVLQHAHAVVLRARVDLGVFRAA